MFYIAENTNRLDEEFLSLADPFLSSQRREKLMSLGKISDRINGAAVYLLLRYALYNEYGISDKPEFIYGKNGKPFLSDSNNIFFGLTHCRNSCACVTAEYETASDITDLRPISMRTAKRFCSEAELSELEVSSDPQRDIIRLWTIKECLAKADGSGLFADFKSIGKAQRDKLQLVEGIDYIAACCIKKKTEVIKITEPLSLIDAVNSFDKG